MEVIDYIDDNAIGDMNIGNNWGNTIVIKHLDGLYTKLSHLKKESIKIAKGDYVKKGDSLALVGNSGRSPFPHLHFQVQATPYIGSKTLDYPLGNYIHHENGVFNFKSYTRPNYGDIVSNVQKNSTLSNAFNLIPGQRIQLKTLDPKYSKELQFDWEIQSDIYNYTYIFCQQTNSKAYFHNDGNVFYFTRFEGNKNSLLFAFYLALYKVLTGFYNELMITDTLPPGELNNIVLLTIQDFIAPFYVFLKTEYKMRYVKMEDDFGKSEIYLKSEVSAKIGKWSVKKYEFEILIKNDRFEHLIIIDKNRRIEVGETESN